MLKELLEVRVLGSATKIAAQKDPQLLYLLVGVRTPPNVPQDHQPLNLCLVIDRSTSMKHRLRPIKSAATMILEQLGEHDLFSAVAFSDRAELIVSSARSGMAKSAATKIHRIIASGGTEMYHGLKTGTEAMSKVNLSDFANELILLTDGHTYGDERDCLLLARDAAERGIEFSAYGIGTEWNDQFLDQLVAMSGGESAYIESPKEIVRRLQQRLKGMGQVYARNLRLQTEFPLNVKVQSAFKVTPFAQPLKTGGDGVQMGTVESHAPLAVLLELSIEYPQLGESLELPLKVISDVPSLQVENHVVSRTYTVVVEAEESAPNPPKVLVEAVRAFNLQRMNEKVREDVEQGRLKAATTRLGYLEKRLLETGQVELAKQARAETRRLETQGGLSPEGTKRLKYGTRSLASQTFELTLDHDGSV